jgi:hypothetical protein
MPCSTVVFKCSHGKIISNGCSLFYTPDTARNCTIKAFKKIGHRLQFIDSINISVREFEDVGAWLNNKSGGIISKSEVELSSGLRITEDVDGGHYEPIICLSYRVIAIRGDSCETAFNSGGKYNEKVISLIKNLNINDKLIFSEIKAQGFLRKTLSIRPLEFVIQ